MARNRNRLDHRRRRSQADRWPTSGMPVGTDVRERLRAAQRAESEAIAAVQKAQAAEADARERLDAIILKHQGELSKAAHAVLAARARVVDTSGLERAATLLDISPKVLRSAITPPMPPRADAGTRHQVENDMVAG